MSLCFAFLCNDAGLSTAAQAAFREPLMAEGGARFGWGLAYYQAGQPLLRKKPRGPSTPWDLCSMAADVRSNVMLAHVRGDDVGGLSNENTQPFRFRGWTFVHGGAMPRIAEFRSELLDAIPDFMRRNIRGTTGSELLFHLFLTFLNDMGRIDDPRLEGKTAARALQAALAYLERVAGDAGAQPQGFGCVASNGRMVVAARRQMPMALSRKSSYLNVGRGPDDKPISYPHLKAIAIVGGKEPRGSGWESLDEKAVLVVDSDLNIEYSSPAGG